jgi:crotonobetainyl-CoA:carnitine CoA-transferase CaiB-like acyl-CoA transferase
MTPQAALEGVKVLDISTFMAGPWAAVHLANFGADVLKVERPVIGDQIRRFGGEKNGASILWPGLDHNKKGISLNLSDPRGAEILKRLVVDFDVVVENFRPGTLERWGLGWDVLREINPRLIMLRITGYGQDGPYRSRPGFGSIMEAFAGFAHMTGQLDGPPTIPPVPLADGSTAMMGAFAIMVALYWRDVHGGTGQQIDLSLYEPMLQLEEPRLADWELDGKSTVRSGNRLADGAPRNTFACQDGQWICLSGSSQETALRVFDVIGRPELKASEKFHTNAARVRNNDELEDLIRGFTEAHPRQEVLDRFGELGVPAAPIYDIPSVFEDEHVKFRGTFQTVSDDQLGTFRILAPVPRMSQTPGEITSTGPKLGEHNADVFAKLGLTEDEIRNLEAEGVM